MDLAFLAMMVLHVGIGVLAVVTGVTAMGQPDRLSTPAPRLVEAAPLQSVAVASELDQRPIPVEDALVGRSGAAPTAIGVGFDEDAPLTGLRGRVLVELWREWPEGRGALI